MALRASRTWEQISALLAEHGPAHPRSYWHSVSMRRFDPGWREVDALLIANGQEPQGPPPAEEVAGHEIRQVVRQADTRSFDTMALANLDGQDCAEVVLKVGNGNGSGEKITANVLVTRVTRPATKRKPRKPGVMTLADIPPVDPAKIGRGKSGNQEAIRAAVARAAAEMRGEGE